MILNKSDLGRLLRLRTLCAALEQWWQSSLPGGCSNARPLPFYFCASCWPASFRPVAAYRDAGCQHPASRRRVAMVGILLTADTTMLSCCRWMAGFLLRRCTWQQYWVWQPLLTLLLVSAGFPAAPFPGLPAWRWGGLNAGGCWKSLPWPRAFSLLGHQPDPGRTGLYARWLDLQKGLQAGANGVLPLAVPDRFLLLCMVFVPFPAFEYELTVGFYVPWNLYGRGYFGIGARYCFTG